MSHFGQQSPGSELVSYAKASENAAKLSSENYEKA
jgi:hypothetical protein